MDAAPDRVLTDADPLIRTVEELALNAWPALHTMFHDGWVLRFADGYTRRANSVNPLYSSQEPLEAKIAACEQQYAAQGLPALFKMTAASQPAELDAALAARGYRVDAPTSVQLLDLRGLDPSPAGRAELTPAFTEEWFAAFCHMGTLRPQHQPTARQLLASIRPPTAFAAIRREGQIVACGLAVAQRGYVGLFDVATDPSHRRQGHGQQLLAELLRWARGQGAHTAYLQVMVENEPALRLYHKLGFRERYRYWYRVR